MDNLQRIALLIDADNTQMGKIEAVIREISTHGRIVVKKAFGNWRKDSLKGWEEEIKRLAINASQQFDYVSGKNVSDIALVIDAMDMLYKDLYDAFVIVSSDSDYTPLAIRIHESGVYVIGVGEKKTPVPFRNACDEFIFLENLGEESQDVEVNKKKRLASKKSSKAKKNKAKSAKKDAERVETTVEVKVEDETVESINELHSLLRIAYDRYADDDGFVNVASAGTFIKRAMPDFDTRTYGYTKLPQLIEDFPEKYEVTRKSGKGTTMIIAYKCID